MFFGAMLAAHPLVWALGLTPPTPVTDHPSCYSARCQIAVQLEQRRDEALARIEDEQKLWKQSIVVLDDITTPHPEAEVCVAVEIEIPKLELPMQPAPVIARTATHAADSAS